MATKPYGLICPITKACELLQARWTIPILCEMWGGESRFNDIRRAVGGVSPTVLSRRLNELEQAGLVERIQDKASGVVSYIRTPKAVALEPALMALAEWAQTHIDAEMALSFDISTYMLKLRHGLDPEKFPARRGVIRFHFSDVEDPLATYWLLMNHGAPPELCIEVPGFDVDLYIETTAVSFGAIVMGRSSLAREIDLGRLYVSGDAVLQRTMEDWFPRSDLADSKDICLLPEPIEQKGAGQKRANTEKPAQMV